MYICRIPSNKCPQCLFKALKCDAYRKASLKGEKRLLQNQKDYALEISKCNNVFYM